MPQMRVAPSLWSEGATELILDTSKNTKTKKTKNKKKRKSPQNVKSEGPPWGRSMSDWPEGTRAPRVRIGYVPVISHCEFSWHDFAGACGRVSEGVAIEILGVSVFRILFLSVNRCLSDFLTVHNHTQEYRPLILKWTKEGDPQPGGGTALGDGRGNVDS